MSPTTVALVFLALHIVTTVLDGYMPIRAQQDAVVPFMSKYRPIWLGLGAVAFDLLLALTITSLLRASIGYRTRRSSTGRAQSGPWRWGTRSGPAATRG